MIILFWDFTGRLPRYYLMVDVLRKRQRKQESYYLRRPLGPPTTTHRKGDFIVLPPTFYGPTTEVWRVRLLVERIRRRRVWRRKETHLSFGHNSLLFLQLGESRYTQWPRDLVICSKDTTSKGFVFGVEWVTDSSLLPEKFDWVKFFLPYFYPNLVTSVKL